MQIPIVFIFQVCFTHSAVGAFCFILMKVHSTVDVVTGIPSKVEARFARFGNAATMSPLQYDYRFFTVLSELSL